MADRATLLIADADKFIRTTLTRLFKESMNIAVSSNAKETWERIEQQQPDLVLLDLRFPDCQDLPLLSRIKQSYPGIAVIMLTSQPEDLSQVVDAVKIGAFDY